MIGKCLLSTVLLVVVGASQTVEARTEREPLVPSSSWQLQRERIGCEIYWTFPADQTFRLSFITGFEPNSFQISLLSNDIHFSEEDVPVTLEISPQGISVNSRGFADWLRQLRQNQLAAGNFDLGFLNRFEDSQIITLSVGSRYERSFRLTNFVSALSELQSCQSDLFAAWGADITALQAMTRLPEPIDASNWITRADYSMDMRRGRIGGWVKTMLETNASGEPINCRIVVSSNSEELDELTCALLLDRARFAPAQNAQGEPVSAPYFLNIEWRPDW